MIVKYPFHPKLTKKTKKKDKIRQLSDKSQNFQRNFFAKNLMANEKIFCIKNYQHVINYRKPLKNCSKSPFFLIVGGVLKAKKRKKRRASSLRSKNFQFASLRFRLEKFQNFRFRFAFALDFFEPFAFASLSLWIFFNSSLSLRFRFGFLAKFTSLLSMAYIKVWTFIYKLQRDFVD